MGLSTCQTRENRRLTLDNWIQSHTRTVMPHKSRGQRTAGVCWVPTRARCGSGWVARSADEDVCCVVGTLLRPDEGGEGQHAGQVQEGR